MLGLGLAIAVSLSAAAPCRAQSAECQDAYEFLTHVKEQLFVNPSQTELQALQYAVKARTRQCGDLAELWQVRERLAQLLHDDADIRVVRQRGSRFFVDKVYPEHGRFNAATPLGKRWALLAGTNTFANKKDLGIQDDLEYAEADVKLLERTLSSTFGFSDVQTLVGDAFTLEHWRLAIARLREQASEDDLVFVYLASHGRPTKDDVSNHTSFILTHDSRGPDMAQIYTTSIQVIDLVQELSRELRAQRVVIMLDSCFSGDAISGQRDFAGRPAPHLLDAFTRGAGRAVVTAARADQRSAELTSRQQGPLAYCFAKAATRTATLGQIFTALQACVTEEVKTLGPEHAQVPQFFASDGARAIVLGASNASK